MNELLKDEIVSSIQLGLSISKNKLKNNGGIINNHRRSEKIDDIMNSIIDSVKQLKECKTLKYTSRGYELLFLYDSKNRKIYSFHSENRFSQLLVEKTRGSQSYLFSIALFNVDEDRFPRLQQCLFENDSDPFYYILLRKNQDISNLIGEEGNDIEHIAVVYNYKGYELKSVKLKYINQYGELMLGLEEDLSSRIKVVDYNSINPLSNEKIEFNDEIISPKLKAKYVSREIAKEKELETKESDSNE